MAKIATRNGYHVLHPTSNLSSVEETGPFVASHGEGIYMVDSNGKRYLEGMAGAWCLGLGYGVEELAEAAAKQIRKLAYVPGFFGRGNEPSIELAERLVDMAPFEASKVFFAASGSEANDTLVRLLWFAANARGETRRKTIIARQLGYHGTAGYSSNLTGLSGYHQGFDGPQEWVRHLTCPHFHRFAKDGEDEDAFVARLAGELRELVEREGTETFAAFIAEPVMGGAGVRIAPKAYFPAMQAVLDEYGIPMVSDEVITGFGRTASTWGAETVGMRPAAMTVAKQLSAAYFPISGLIIGDELYEGVLKGSDEYGLLSHGYTYGGHPVGAAVALRTLDLYEEWGIFDHVKRVSERFAARLAKLAEHESVGQVQSAGLMGAVEIVADKDTKQLFGSEAGLANTLLMNCREEGLLIRQNGERSVICPPMIITDTQVDELFDMYTVALERTLSTLQSERAGALAAR